MPLQATSGAASYDAFGGGVPVVPAYIEEAFSCFLYTGNGSTQTITNGIDLSTKGGLAWLKMRNFNQGHILFDTIRGVENYLQSASSDEQFNLANSLTAFNTTGFTVGSGASTNAEPYVSWSFRKQPKFFDMVSWTGSGSNRTIAHSLGSVPACIMVKRTDVAANWQVYHRSLANTEYLVLNSTAAKATGATRWNSTTPTSTVFSIGTDDTVNASGGTYVAYLFAHDAGGFGLTGTDNVISCGSYSGTGSVPNNITLGFEPQWLLVKNTTSSGQEWGMFDNMRGLVTGTDGDAQLFANASSAENISAYFRVTATGFACEDASTRYNASGNTYIYIAIRRGPMKVPSTGSSVYNAILRTGTGSSQTDSGIGFAPDWALIETRSNAADRYTFSRLQGNDRALLTNTSEAEFSSGLLFNGATGTITNTVLVLNGRTYVDWYFGRAPSFFDEVCYTGTGSTLTLNHNLGVVPELMIGKSRSAAGTNWAVYTTSQGTNSSYLNRDIAFGNNSDWSTAPTATQFTVPSGADLNISSQTQVMYLFATCAGVSKVGTYTGTGTTKQVNCGFTGGARFVLIKRADDTGSWYVWDSSRGIVSGNDPYLLLNSTAAEVTNTDYIDTYSAGFEISSTAPSEINASGGTFIFLAIA